MLVLSLEPWRSADEDAELLERLIAASPVRLIDDEPALPDASWIGVYCISIRKPDDSSPLGQVMYVGSGHLKDRLKRHFDKLAGRRGINEAHVEARWVRTAVHSERSGEGYLILRLAPEWQHMGFGSNRPGRGRAGQRVCEWERLYPPRRAQARRRPRTKPQLRTARRKP